MVKWSFPEKILQNVVQTRCSLANRTLQSKVRTKSIFWFSLLPIHLFHLNLPSLALSDAATPLFLIYVFVYLLSFVYIIFI